MRGIFRTNMAPNPIVQSSGKEWVAPQLPHHKVKIKKPGQRACNEKDAKGKLCGGHLKRWYYVDDIMEREHDGDVEKAFGRDAEIYRCEHCKTLYLPSPVDPQGTNVAGEG